MDRRFAAFRIERAFARLRDAIIKANFNPNQPRIPAGDPAGGQWTKVPGWGGGRDAADTPRVAQVTHGPNFYSFDLRQVYRNGDGHAYPDHVGRSDISMMMEVLGSERVIPLGNGTERVFWHAAEGTFDSIERANDFVAQTLRFHPEAVDKVVAGLSNYEIVTHRFGFFTGREAYMAEPFSTVVIRNTYAVEVIIKPDLKGGSRGYKVVTAYPMNEIPNERLVEPPGGPK